MNMRTRLSTVVISGVTALAIGTTGVSTAYAADGGPTRAADQAEQVTQEQIDQVASYLEAIDKGEHLDADGNFDYEATKAKFGVEFADAFKAYFTDTDVPAGVQRSYASCMLDAIGLGGLAGVSKELDKHIRAKNWRKVAEIGLKEAAKRGMKIAVKGGVAGATAILAAAAVYCIWKGAPTAPETVADNSGFTPASFASREAGSFALAG
ncbi:hypothetical protein ACIO3O_25600 [Streptomyces sp. NPDC087440]|uniref:hypothetical protein n=1 Tax=Streptomyces sp. NPDC087440 TaxID=3365790 RepID=UPI0038083136